MHVVICKFAWGWIVLLTVDSSVDSKADEDDALCYFFAKRPQHECIDLSYFP
jgi:hypothetical protein